MSSVTITAITPRGEQALPHAYKRMFKESKPLERAAFSRMYSTELLDTPARIVIIIKRSVSGFIAPASLHKPIITGLSDLGAKEGVDYNLFDTEE